MGNLLGVIERLGGGAQRGVQQCPGTIGEGVVERIRREIGEGHQCLVDATELHQSHESGDVRFEGRAIHLVGLGEGSIRDRDGGRSVAAVHGRAGDCHQRERSLYRLVGQCQELLGAALRCTGLAECDLGAKQRRCCLHQPELVVELLES